MAILSTVHDVESDAYSNIHHCSVNIVQDVVPWDFDKFYVPPHDSSRLQVDPLWQEYLQVSNFAV